MRVKGIKLLGRHDPSGLSECFLKPDRKNQKRSLIPTLDAYSIRTSRWQRLLKKSKQVWERLPWATSSAQEPKGGQWQEASVCVSVATKEGLSRRKGDLLWTLKAAWTSQGSLHFCFNCWVPWWKLGRLGKAKACSPPENILMEGFVFKIFIWSISATDLKLFPSYKGSGSHTRHCFRCIPLVKSGEVNGNPLQYSCLENPMDRGAWKAAVHGVTKSWTRLSDFTFIFTFMHWRRKWQPTPVFLPGESQGRGSLVGCRLWGCTESDTTEATWWWWW